MLKRAYDWVRWLLGASAPPATITLIEGNIAVGKSTFMRTMQRQCPAVYCRAENVASQFLAAFYAEPARYAFALQMMQLARRQGELECACIHLVHADTSTFLDRSVLGDYAFALWNTAAGNLTRAEWQMYRAEAGERVADVLPRVHPKDLTILFLNDDVDACAERQRQRDAAPIDREYLAGLHAAHLVVMALVPDEYTLIELQWTEYAAFDAARPVPNRRATLRERARATIDALTCSASAREFLTATLDEQRSPS
jgi:deoxyadenosine/deoxycytidine kinase